MKERFSFGQNWQRFLHKDFSEEKVARSCDGLCAMLGLTSLKGMSFLDIGCGSGLSSLAALRLGAERVVSFDYDEQSVDAARTLHAYAGAPSNWSISRGDALDQERLRTLDPFDIVYSWGVLHHTGDMNRAIANSTIPLRKDGLLLLALYSLTAYQNGVAFGQPSPEEWLGIKQRYYRAARPVQHWMMLQYLWRRYFSNAHWRPHALARGARELYTRWKDYQSGQRGMSFFTDIHDWLGGWPMEYVHESELQRRMETEFGMEILRMETGRGNTQFLFRNAGASNGWDALLASRTTSPLPGPYRQVDTLVWLASPPCVAPSDDHRWLCSRLRLREDTLQLPYAHAPYEALRRFGSGRYLHKNDGVYFSTTDNTDPNRNGRGYTFYLDV